MPDAPLPDDLANWPADPFDLLGLARVADVKDAKRAYLKLVRNYKPEHEPEKFKRLRAAFEQVQRQLEFRAQYAARWDEEYDDEEAVEEDVAARSGSPHNEHASATVNETPIIAQAGFDFDLLWSDACGGNESRVYAELLRQRHTGENRSEIYLRLYWLLVANRGLDAELSPCDWLVEGLKSSRLLGPLSELYRRELAYNPLEAAGLRCSSLLDVPAVPGALADLLEWRWRALSKLGRFDLIVDDLRRTRSRIVFEDEDVWARLLLLAIEQMSFAGDQHIKAVVLSCRAELDQLVHLHARLGDDYDRLDLLFEAVAAWQRLKFATDVPAAWTNLLPLAWNPSLDEIRPQMALFLKALGQHPLNSLRAFDALARHSKPAAAQLGQLIERFRYQSGDYSERRDRAAWQATVRRFARFTRSTYLASRERLLDFCLREALDPYWIGPVVDELPRAERYDDDSWTDAIADDGPLRYVYLGYRAYWG